MMATTDDRAEPAEGSEMTFGKVLGALALLFVSVVAGAFTLGTMAAAVTDFPPSDTGIAIIAVGLIVCVACAWGLFRLKPWPPQDELVAPSQRKARNMLLLCGAVGGILGAILSLGMFRGEGLMFAFSNAPLAPLEAIVILVVWLSVVPALSWIWWRNIDEHEAQAYNFGAIIALHLYYLGLPAWWIGWRGGFLPEPRHMLIFLAVTVAWGLGWAWRRYR
jgi:hypothetical protein